MTGNNPNLDLANINAYMYTQFGEISSICSQDIERNENIISNKGHNSVMNFQKMRGNNPKLDPVNTNAHKIFGQILSISSQTKFWYLSVALTLVINLRIITGNNPKLDFVNINAYTKFGQILSFISQDIEWNRNSEGNSEICQGRNSVTNVRKMLCRDPNLNLVYINAYLNFG